jgi:hypothetical protein
MQRFTLNLHTSSLESIHPLQTVNPDTTILIFGGMPRVNWLSSGICQSVLDSNWRCYMRMKFIAENFEIIKLIARNCIRLTLYRQPG